LALAAAALAAVIIGALLFGANRDVGDETAQSAAPITPSATPTMKVSKPTTKPSDGSKDTRGDKSTIQLEDSTGSANPYQAVRIQGTYHGGADTFLEVQRWEAGKWVAFPLPTKTDRSGQFTAYVELEQPGRHRLRVLDPDSGTKSKTVVLVIKA
jgi:hypothetical protein